MKNGADTAEDRGGIGVRTFNRIVRKGKKRFRMFSWCDKPSNWPGPDHSCLSILGSHLAFGFHFDCGFRDGRNSFC